MNRLLSIAFTFVLLNSVAPAVIVFELKEGTDSVALKVSGSFDLAATGGPHRVTPRIILGFMQPSTGEIGVGAPQQLIPYITHLTSWTPFGTGLISTGALGSGTRVDLYNFFEEPLLALPIGYTSGDPIHGTAILQGSFDSLGITAGTFVSRLDSGVASDTVTIIAIPELSSLLLIGISLVMSVLIRCDRNKMLR